MFFRKIFICFFTIRYVLSEEIQLAGLFEQNDIHEKAFRYAIESTNRNQQKGGFTLVALVENGIPEDDTFTAVDHVCRLLNMGVVAVFGPRSSSNINAVQSVCDVKEIPHFITRWNYFHLRGSTEISLYPHAPMLSTAYYDIIMALGWKSFTILYDDNESFLRMSGLMQSAKDQDVIVSVQQLDTYYTGNYRTILKEIKKNGEKFFVVDCRIEYLKEVLLQFQQIGLMIDGYYYFITNLDAHTEDLTSFQYSGTHITGIRILNPKSHYVQKISRELYADDESSFPELAAWKLSTETALLIDAVHMFSIALNDVQKQSSLTIINNNKSHCNMSDSWVHGYSLVNLLKTSSYEGLTGLIKFNNEGFRSNFELNLFELREGEIADIGIWDSSTGLNVTKMRPREHIVNEDGSLRNKIFYVGITLTEPYAMIKVDHEEHIGNDQFEGFGIDLIQKLSQMEGFNYTFIKREDNINGAKNGVTGRWSGMIGDLLEQRIDLAIADFTITSDRVEAVDFTVPFMNVGISILFRKPSIASSSFLSFAHPFAVNTWAALAVAFFVVTFSLYIVGRLCPGEWKNPHPSIKEPEYLINKFSLANSIWFVLGSLMCQGSEIAPTAMSTRMVAGMWWFFCLAVVSSYTANLAAFLATEKTLELFRDIDSLYENALLHKITYGAKRGGATEHFFTKERAEKDIFQKIGQVMRDHPEYNVKDNEEGVRKAKNELYAFFMESTSIEYIVQSHCDLQQYGGLLDEKGYGIAMRKGSPYRTRLSTAILKLQASLVIDELKKKWWKEKNGEEQCAAGDIETVIEALDLKNLKGVFWVTISGTILAFLLSILETILHVAKRSVRTKTSFKIALKEEFKFILKFRQRVKPSFTNCKK